MKKTFVIKAIAAIFATAMMSFTTATEASAQNTFVYGQDGNTMTVSTLRTRRKHNDRFYAECRWHLDYAEAEIRIPIRCQREPGGKESLSLECR